jgi:hypothetical protein
MTIWIDRPCRSRYQAVGRRACRRREMLSVRSKSRAFLVREGRADSGPLLLGLAVAFVFLDGEHVEVGGDCRGCRCYG